MSIYSFLFLLVAPYNVTTTGNNRYPQGEQLVLNCQSEGGPQLEYSWIFSGNVIANASTLTFDNVNASNGGDYICNVTNNAGSQSDTFTVYSELVCMKNHSQLCLCLTSVQHICQYLMQCHIH